MKRRRNEVNGKFSHLCLSFDKDARAISPSKLEREKEKGRGGGVPGRGEPKSAPLAAL